MTNLDLERLKNKAIDEAVNGNYEEAIAIIQQILVQDPNEIDSLMQLAHAYWQTGELSLAKKYYRQALNLEPSNGLAKKRLALLNSLDGKYTQNRSKRNHAKVVAINDLIEEPGKTKIIKLSNIGKPEHLSLLKIGEEVFLKNRKRRLEIRDLENNFIGCLPDDICKRLTTFIDEKGVYEVYIFSIDKNEVKVFIKEIVKPAKYRHVSSFVTEEKGLEIEDEDSSIPIEEPDLDLDSEKLLFSPEEVLTSPKSRRHNNDEDEDEDDDEDDEDKKTYQEYEE